MRLDRVTFVAGLIAIGVLVLLGYATLIQTIGWWGLLALPGLALGALWLTALAEIGFERR